MDDLLPDEIARTVLAAYRALPKTGKPRQQSPSQHSWTVLAAFYLVRRPPGLPRTVECLTLGTGLKVLPRSRLPPHGDILHDSHAEVIAHRGLKLWLYDQLELASRGEDSCLEPEEGGVRWRLRSGLEVGLYVSTLPCGDASTYTLSLLSPDDATRPSPTPAPTLTPSTIQAAALGLHTLRSPSTNPDLSTSLNDPSLPVSPAGPLAVHRGRTAYATLSALRTKPGRLDSPPTTSHSCSDKIAMWAWAGLEGSLLSGAGVGRVGLGWVVVGGVEKGVEGGWERVGEEVRRAVGGRVRWPGGKGSDVWGEEGVERLPEVGFTNVEFEGHKETVAKRVGPEVKILSCPDSLSFVAGREAEVIQDGKRQGSGSKRQPGDALPPKLRSRLCKLSLMTTHLAHPAVGDAVPSPLTYHALKRSAGASEYRARKAALRAVGAPFEGWIEHGGEWEAFREDGRLVEKQVEGATAEA